jgi:hypothetical protein
MEDILEGGPEPLLPANDIRFEPEPLPSKRIRRFPRAYNDYIPSSQTVLSHIPKRKTARQLAQERLDAQQQLLATQAPAPEPSPSPEPDVAPETFSTEPDEFGLYREYTHQPTLVPVPAPSDVIDSSHLLDPRKVGNRKLRYQRRRRTMKLARLQKIWWMSWVMGHCNILCSNF